MQSLDIALATLRPTRGRPVSFGAGLAYCVALTLVLAVVVSIALQLASTASSGSLAARTERAQQMLKIASPQS